MNKLKYVIGAALASLTLAAGVALPKVVGAQPVVEDKVTICHRTNSVKNRYVQITVDKSAVDGQGNNDHTHHTGPVATSEAVAQALKDAKTKWGDIIPPFDNYPGYNWDQDGQGVYENGCGNQEITEVVPAAVTFKTPTCDSLGSYTIPTTENVEYLINGQVVAAGTYTAQNGTTVNVVAEAGENYFIADGTTDSWSYTFTAPTNCGQVLGEQVTTKPTSGVSAGGGGGSANTVAVVGLVGSIATIGLGLLIRKFNV